LLSFFKINDPYRLIAIFLIAFAIKIPFLINSCSYFEMHHWLIIGEAMRSNHMYEQIFDTLAPFSASVYWFVESIFGRSVVALHLLGTLLVVVQAVIFNNLTIENKVYEKNSYLPAFAYIILSSVHYSQTVFSPAQLGLTFILLAFGKLLSHVEFRAKREEQIMSIGLLIGIATLFYLPYILFLPIFLILLLIYTNTIRRRFFLLIISTFILPIIVFAYYALALSKPGYVSMILSKAITVFDFSIFANVWHSIFLLLPILLAWVLGFITMPKQRRLNNYQNRLAQLFFLTGLLSISIIIFHNTGIDVVLILFIPIAAFFVTHLFLLIKKPLTDLGVTLLFLMIVLVTNYDSEFGFLGIVNRIEPEIKIDTELVDFVKGKRIMVLGDKPQLYKYGSLGTPFYEWSLAKPIVNNLNFYDNLVFINESIKRYQPQLIIDYELRWGKITNHIPKLKKEYKQVKPFVWIRIDQ